MNQIQFSPELIAQLQQARQAMGGLAPDPNAVAAPTPQVAQPPPVAPQGPPAPAAAPMPPPIDMDAPAADADTPPPAPRELEAPPAGMAAATPANHAANVPGLDPGIMAQLAGPAAAPQTRAAGMSPADTKNLREREELEKQRREEGTKALDALQTNADTAQEQSQVLADDMTISKLQAAHDAKADTDRMSSVREDAKAASTRLQSELADMQAQGIDPNRYWQNQSTPAKIGAAIAIGLGEFGAALGHRGTNSALEIINGAVNRDLEAQKSNMQKNLQLAQMKAAKNGQDFDVDSAMAKAERESHQAAWSVALADFDRRAEMLKGNTAVQTQLAQMRQGIVSRMEEGTEGKIQNEYQVRKGAEKQVAVAGAGGIDIDKKAVLAKADKLVDDYAAKGITLQRPQALRLALEGMTGAPAGPEGFAAMPAVPQKGAAEGKESPRIATRIAEMTARIGELKEAKELAEQGTWSPAKQQRYATIRAGLPPDVQIPETPYGFVRGTIMGRQDAISQAIEGEKRKLQALRAEVPKVSSGGAEPETP
jgi:hypothetical protein